MRQLESKDRWARVMIYRAIPYLLAAAPFAVVLLVRVLP